MWSPPLKIPRCGSGEKEGCGGPTAGQGQGSTYSTVSHAQAEAFPAPPGRHTGERGAGEGSCWQHCPCPLTPGLAALTSSWSLMALSCSSFLAQYLASSSGISVRAKTPAGAQTSHKTAFKLLGPQDQTLSPSSKADEQPWGSEQGKHSLGVRAGMGQHPPSGSSKRVSRRMRWKVGSLVPEISLSVMMTCESSVSHSPGPSCWIEMG